MSSEAGDLKAPPEQVSLAQSPQTPGTLLQQERVRRGLSVQQAAEGLHLDPWIIEAMEANRFLALGAPVYAKGYLRKFALLLGLAPDVVIARYEALTDTPVVPTPVPVITTTPPPRPKWPKYVGWAALVAVLLLLAWLAFELFMPASPATQSVTTGAVDQPRVAPEPTLVAQVVNAASDSAAGATAAAPPLSAPPVAAPAAVTAPPVQRPAVETQQRVVDNAEGATRLRLEFSEASWVEVYDANDQRLLYDIGQPGRPRLVSGQAPLNVVVGLAAAVTAEVNDRKIVVPRRANRDSTRFTVAADGSVR